MGFFDKFYELPITRNYVAAWTAVEAIRELFQNAIDHDKNLWNVELVKDSREGEFLLTIISDGVRLSPKTLLLGHTSKADDDSAIGHFGEGYKLALLVLAREGYDVWVRNSEVIWRPAFQTSDKFGEEVLVIHETKNANWSKGDEDSLQFCIGRLPGSVTDNVKQNTLYLQEDIGAMHRTRYGDILLARPGKLYINGLYVCETGLNYGYNVKPEHLELERDRQTVSHFNLRFLTKDMWFDAEQPDTVAAMMEVGAPDMEYAQHSCPELIKEACYRLFREKHPGAVIAGSQYELDAMVKKGMTDVVIYNDSYKSVISSYRNYQADLPKVVTKSPIAHLEEFFRAHRGNMRTPAIVTFKEVIEKSKGWR